MISGLRRGAKSPLVLAILALVALAFVITGVTVPGAVGGGTGGAIAAVDGLKVTQAEVIDQANRRLTQIRTENPEADMGQLVAGGAIEGIVDGLVSLKAVRAFADRIGLIISKDMVDGEIASIPAFRGLTGKFDEGIFRAKLGEERISEAQLRDDLYSTLLQRVMLAPIDAAARTPLGLAQPFATMLSETRQGFVGVVDAERFAAGPAPSDAEVQAFYRGNRARYTQPERRVLRYALFGKDQVQTPAPSEAEIAAFYQSNRAAYGGSETRVLSQVVLPTEAAARDLAAKVAAGASFAAAAKAAGFSAGDISLGPQSRKAFAGIANAQVADAAFAAQQGAITAPIRSPLGFHVVKVDEIRRVPGQTLAQARPLIAAQLQRQKTDEGLASLVDSIEEEIADGATFEEVTTRRRLAVTVTPPITGSGVAPGDRGYRPPLEVQPLLKTAFEADAEEDATVEQVGERYALLDIGNVAAAAPPPLQQIRAQVESDVRAKKASDRARAVAAAIEAKVNRGMPMAQAFREAGVGAAPRPITAQRLDVVRAQGQIPPPIQLLFSLPKGRARLLPAGQERGFFIVQHFATAPAKTVDPRLLEATQQQFSQAAGSEYAEQFVGAIERGAKIRRDEAKVRQLKRQLDGSAPVGR